MTATLPPPVSGALAWRPLDARRRAWSLGNRVLVEETSGLPKPGQHQLWRWQVAAIGGDAGSENDRDKAFRAAEFALGLGEQPVLNLFTPNPSAHYDRPEQLPIV